MSEASMPFQPAIDEPSNAWPEVNLSSSNADTGTETCCSLPRVSVKRKSTNLISFSFTMFITSATVFAIKNLLAEARVGGCQKRGKCPVFRCRVGEATCSEALPGKQKPCH